MASTIDDPKGKVVKRSSNSYSSEEWKSHRPLITKLYFEEGKTLKEVREYLEREHGFAPTERMYKSRLHSWGLDKKKKEHEMLDLVRQGLSQKGDDKDKVFLVRGRQVTLADALHYFNRKGIKDPASLLDSNNLEALRSPSSPEDYDIETPLSSRGEVLDEQAPVSESEHDLNLSPQTSASGHTSALASVSFHRSTDVAEKQLAKLCQQLRIPQLDPLPPFRNVSVEASIKERPLHPNEVQYLEAIVGQAQSHYRQIFRTRDISLSTPARHPWSATSDDALADQFYYAMYHGYSFLWNNQRQAALQNFNKAFSMVEQLLNDSHVGFLIYILDLVIRHDGASNEEPLTELLQQISRTAKAIHNDTTQPMYLIALWLENAPVGVSRSWVALGALRKLLDFFQDSIGYFHPETIALLQTFATGLMNKQLYSEAAVRFQQLIDAFSLTQSKHSYEVCYALRSTSEAFFHDNKFYESLQALKMALSWAVELPRPEEREIYVRCLRAMAEISNKIGQYDDANQTMQSVVDICVDTFGSEHTFTTRARMHQKSLRDGDGVMDTALPPVVYRLGRGGDAAKHVWTTCSTPTRLQP